MESLRILRQISPTPTSSNKNGELVLASEVLLPRDGNYVLRRAGTPGAADAAAVFSGGSGSQLRDVARCSGIL